MNAEERKEFEALKKEYEEIFQRTKGKADIEHLSVYRKPSHFIYELLQNAEDAGAKEVKFVLTEDTLETYHDGKPFNLKDVKGIMNIGVSDKKDDENRIGKFGIGFKSVFAVTSNPCIFSGCYNLEIEIKHWIRFTELKPELGNRTKKSETLIRLPFNHNQSNNHNKFAKEEAFKIVCNELENLEPKVLLFLKNIKTIRWETISAKGRHSKETDTNNFQSVEKLDVKEVRLSAIEDTTKYLTFGKQVNVEGKETYVEIAFKLGEDENGKKRIIQDGDSKLVVFFPTGRETFLNFVMHGPYATTADRNDILELEYNSRNRTITERLGQLVAESLPVIRDLEYLDTDFLRLLPIDSSKKSDDVYEVLYDNVKDALASGELLPNFQRKYVGPNKAILADSRSLTSFWTEADLQTLFERADWLDTSIPRGELSDYLKREFDIPRVDFEDFVRKLNKEFIQEKSDEWLVDFYTELLSPTRRGLWSRKGENPRRVLDHKPIIRLNKTLDTGHDDHCALFDDNGQVQVFYQSGNKSNYLTVKESLVENGKSKDFLDALGIDIPNVCDEVRVHILTRHKTKNDHSGVQETFDDFTHRNRVQYEEYPGEFIKILEAYMATPLNEKREFRKVLAGTYFVPAIENKSLKLGLVTPQNAYLDTSDLREFFNGEEAYFFDSQWIGGDKERVETILKTLGVADTPRRRLRRVSDLTEAEKEHFKESIPYGYSAETLNRYAAKAKKREYEYEGLENFMKFSVGNGITLERSYVLWKLLTKSCAGLKTDDKQKFFKDVLFVSNQLSIPVEAEFLKTLKQCEWLFDENNNPKKPSDITFSELNGIYKQEEDYASLENHLVFKPEENVGEMLQRVMDKEGLTPEEAREALADLASRKRKTEEAKNNSSVKLENVWTPECKPEEIRLIVQEVEFDILPNSTTTASQFRADESREDDRSPIDKKYKKAIGEWGEKCVYDELIRKYEGNEEIEVEWCNEGGKDTGVGYDFIIKSTGDEGEVIQYIEVKSTIQETPASIHIQGTQWDTAKEWGDRYYIYVVSNAGRAIARGFSFNNPVKLWCDDVLKGHPINIRLPRLENDAEE